MLVSVSELALNFGCHPKIVWHLGGHNAEELDDYLSNGVKEIHWFEANPEQAGILSRKLKNIPNQYVVLRAVWDSDEEILQFKITNNTMSSSVYNLGIHSEIYPDIALSKTVEVESVTLNTYSIGREIPNLINLDIQGAEFNALKGAGNFLDQVAFIYTEVSFVELYQNAPLADEIDCYLQRFGFKRVLTRKVPRDGWADVLYVNQHLVKLPFRRLLHRLFNDLDYAIRSKVYEIRVNFHDLMGRS
jgi:FkbM family methyltransferase